MTVHGAGSGEGLARGRRSGAGVVEKALWDVNGAEHGEAFWPGHRVERCRGEGGDHGVVGVGVHGAVAAEGEDYVVLLAANALDQHGSGGGEVSELELSVLVVEDFGVGETSRILQEAKNSLRRISPRCSPEVASPRLVAAWPSVKHRTVVSMPASAASIRAPPKAKHSSSGWAVTQRSLRGGFVGHGQIKGDRRCFFGRFSAREIPIDRGLQIGVFQ